MHSINGMKAAVSFILGFLIIHAVIVGSEGNCKLFENSTTTYLCEDATASFKLQDTSLNNSFTYLWHIQPKSSKTVKVKTVNLFFVDLFLNQGDEITVYETLNDSSNSSLSIIKPIRSQKGAVTVLTSLTELFVKFDGKSKNDFVRKFQCDYTASPTVSFAIHPEVTVVESPIYFGNESSTECMYRYTHDQHHTVIPVFRFDPFDFENSSVELTDTTYPEPSYKKDTPMDFFPSSDNPVTITVKLINFTEKFVLKIDKADSRCSGYIKVNNAFVPIKSPDYALDNGTFGQDCIWVAKLEAPVKSAILGVAFTKLIFDNALDIVAINDGGSAKSPPSYQVTTSNSNNSLTQVLRVSGSLIWIAFKPVTFNSRMEANITFYGQGGNFKGSGEISMHSTVGNDTVFILEVEENKSVMLNFSSSEFADPATLNIYDGVDTKHLIAALHGNIWYPVISPSSKMMIIATSFNTGSFTAQFHGIEPGCLHMSSMSDENYILSGNCNNTCLWVIPPQNSPGSVMLLNLQYISLGKEDSVVIYRLNDSTTPVGSVDSAATHLPQLVFPASTGALVNITRKACSKKDDIALIGHSSFVPACGGILELEPSETFHVTSPLYPDTYPLLDSCKWTLLSAASSLIHLAFNYLSLAPNHCITVFNTRTKSSTVFSASNLPEDLFLANGSTIQFQSSKCTASKEALQLVSSGGFMLNGTVAECGSVFDKKSSGEFTVNVTSLKQSVCMWKVSVPITSDNANQAVNIITYAITTKDNKGNYEFKVYDGASVRDAEITNITSTSKIWSRTNNLIFFYRRPNISQASSVFQVKYNVLTCNSSMLCDNNVCMHPDWRCNGVNDCGDFTDEKNCASVPIPPEIKTSGYSSSSFWGTVISMLFLGLVLGVVVPMVYSKYKNGQYRRFGDISVIE